MNQNNNCFNDIYFVGNLEAVTKIKNAFRKYQNLEAPGGFGKALKDLGITDIGMQYYNSDITMVSTGLGRSDVLFAFIESSTDVSPILERLCEKYGLSYVSQYESEQNIIIHNDVEEKWFKEAFVLELKEDFKGVPACSKSFFSEKELLSFVNSTMEEKESPYVTRWSFEHDVIEAGVGTFKDAYRVGEQVEKPAAEYTQEEFEEIFGDLYDEVNKDPEPVEEEILFE